MISTLPKKGRRLEGWNDPSQLLKMGTTEDFQQTRKQEETKHLP